jgi:hypothetical protein
MDVTAYVPCNCYHRGLAKPAPVAIEFENGKVASVDPELEPAAEYAFTEWCRTACAHPNLCADEGSLGSSHRVRAFIAELEALGSPVALLASVLPRDGAGSVDSAAAAMCLKEVVAFRGLSVRRLPHLVDSATQRVLRAREGVFFEAQGGDLGFDAYGVFVADHRALETRPVDERIRFRAKHVYVTPQPNGCELRDLDGDATTTCSWDPPAGECELEVVMRAAQDPQFASLVDTLERLFTAAVVWSTAVYWR